MGHRKLLNATGAAALTLIIAGCSVGTSESTPRPTAAAIGKASTIEEVRDAFIEAGGVCNWEQTDVVKAATASGTCSSKTFIMLFTDRSEREPEIGRASWRERMGQYV